MEWMTRTGLLAVMLMVAACSGSSSFNAREGVEARTLNGEFSVSIPGSLMSMRALNADSLNAVVVINGQSTRYSQGTPVNTRFSVDGGGSLSVSVEWFEVQAAGVDLLLAAWSETRVINADVAISVSSADYVSEGIEFDFDSDGFSNLVERRAGSNAFDIGDTPVSLADVRVTRIDPADAPEIDGKYDLIWDQAQFTDVKGNQLLIDNLMINQGADSPDGDTGFKWFSLHDDVNLYVFVLGESQENTASGGVNVAVRDSFEVWQDDTVNLFIDGNNSKLESYDGFDDRHIFIPLLSSPDSQSDNSTVFVRGEHSATIPDFAFATCKCSPHRQAWEIKIPLESFNIQKSRSFGFDVQLDDDDDGGARDARWGWFHPARTGVDIDRTWVNPSYMGTVVLE